MAIFGGMAKKRNALDDLARQAAEVGAPRPMPAGAGGIHVNGQPVDQAMGPENFRKMASRVPEQRKPRRGLGGFMERFRDDIMPRLVVAGAIAQGDYQSAAQLQTLYARQAAARQESEQEAAALENLSGLVAGLPGMTAREFASFLGNPEQWASHNADALSSHHAAANVSQNESRVFGNPEQGGSVYRPQRYIENGPDLLNHNPMTGETGIVHKGMTDGEFYARAQGFQPGTADWGKAVQDAELGANGPTAFGYDAQLEGIRHGNRKDLRGTPTWRQANPAPPKPRSSRTGGGGGGRSSRAPREGDTATGPGGVKIVLRGGQWVRVN